MGESNIYRNQYKDSTRNNADLSSKLRENYNELKSMSPPRTIMNRIEGLQQEKLES